MADDTASPGHDALALLRERGADRRDPVRFRLAEGLARRASAHAGAARRAIEEKLAALLARFESTADASRDDGGQTTVAVRVSAPALAHATATAPGPAPARAPTRVPVCAPARDPGALAALVDHAARQKAGASTPATAPRAVAAPSGATAADAPAGAAADAGTVHFFKRTWSRLSADQRLAQSRASLPENAGPLNSQHLVHRSLVLMRELSPEYLERFVGYIDALQWVEQSNEAAQEAAGGGRPAPAKRAMAARRG